MKIFGSQNLKLLTHSNILLGIVNFTVMQSGVFRRNLVVTRIKNTEISIEIGHNFELGRDA